MEKLIMVSKENWKMFLRGETDTLVRYNHEKELLNKLGKNWRGEIAIVSVREAVENYCFLE